MSPDVNKLNTGASTRGVPDDMQHLPENLRRLDRLANLGLVSASVAHEIKNGLVAINTFIEVLLEKGEDKEMATMVRSELKRIDALATQMLRFSTPKAAALTTVHVHELLDHSLRLLEHQMAGRMITLKRIYHATPDTVRGDEAQLQQAFMNLLLNAAEAIGSNGELTLKTETTAEGHGERRLKIHIQDTGAGIAAEHLPRLFEPFFTTKKNGTGLGLSICQRVAQEHQGSIEVKSELGRGTTFIVVLAAES
jgi:signal transduction histidine kinase